LGPLNEDFKFFVANLPLTATAADIRRHFEVIDGEMGLPKQNREGKRLRAQGESSFPEQREIS
jgi:hypothetical protein